MFILFKKNIRTICGCPFMSSSVPEPSQDLEISGPLSAVLYQPARKNSSNLSWIIQLYTPRLPWRQEDHEESTFPVEAWAVPNQSKPVNSFLVAVSIGSILHTVCNLNINCWLFSAVYLDWYYPILLCVTWLWVPQLVLCLLNFKFIFTFFTF